MLERQAGDLEVRGSNPGSRLNFSLSCNRKQNQDILHENHMEDVIN